MVHLRPDNIFHPDHYSSVRLPRERASALPSWCYTDESWFQRELARAFRPAWHFIDLATSLPRRGDFLTASLFDEPIIVLRDDDGGIRAYRNSCRHRGSLLLEAEQGNCRAIRCPFHSWTYGLDGTLLMAPGTEEEHDRSRLGGLGRNLVPVPCETREGLIFVNFAKDGHVSLDAYLGDYIKQVAEPYRTSRMVCTRRQSYSLRTNWKTYAEVELETLHIKHVHRKSVIEQSVSQRDSAGQWCCVVNTDQPTPARFPDARTTGFPKAQGAYGPAAEGTYFSTVFPGSFLVTAPDCMWWVRKTPRAPDRTDLDIGYCFPRETTERADFEEVAQGYYDRWDHVAGEDNWITEVQQRGFYGGEPGCYTPEESVVHVLDNWILDRVLSH